MSENKYICIHGHFYQPPRENPWLEEVEFQESAYPYHDWNARITAECYAPNSACRIMDAQGRIIGLVNNYTKISFNFGPTLLLWMEQHQPALYQAILDADKESMKNFSGHGSAIAQVYNHMIMPLANKKDKETQIKWGIKDFESRFKRFPEGMWLPETAVDNQTLETLAENGINYTILGPHQAKRVRKIGDITWQDATKEKLDTKKTYTCKLPSGKSINIIFYDWSLSSDASFGGALSNGEFFANKLLAKFGNDNKEPGLVSLATDGELYGHHRVYGDMTLAYCLYYIENNKLAKITNFGEFLEKAPPQFEAEIQENTSWSCSHGIERWRSDCGDNTGRPGWRQGWRKPLREAMDWLRDTTAPKFEAEAQKYLKDPWEARNQYVNFVLDRSQETLEGYLSEQAKKPLTEDEKKQVMKLLEMQRQLMLLYTSCGWFFDEISGIETVQVLMYAARAMQLAHEALGLDLEADYTKMLEKAPTNIPEFVNGENIYHLLVKPAMMTPSKISAQNMILTLFPNDLTAPTPTEAQRGCCFKITISELEKHETGKFRFATGRVKVHSDITLDEEEFGCAAVWLGDHNVSCGSTHDMRADLFNTMKTEMRGSFQKGQINETIQLIPKHFGDNTYSLKDMFKDDQRRILDFVVADGVRKSRELYQIVYHDNSALLRFMKEIRVPAPRALRVAAEVVLNMSIAQMLNNGNIDMQTLHATIEDTKNLSVDLDSQMLGLQASQRICSEFGALQEAPEDIEHIQQMISLIKAVIALPIKLDLWNAQNIAFRLAETKYKERKTATDDNSKTWTAAFKQLCELIGIRLE
jgi:alpha-amylase/alpha-mannosidase (GH57 family)